MSEIYQFFILYQDYIPLMVLALFFLFQIYYTLGVHTYLASYKVEAIENEYYEPISVVICARNEHENLIQFLPVILNQDYPEFEVVVVNDRSSDDSEIWLHEMMQKYSNLQVVKIVDSYKFKFSKKYALTMGIKKAQYEWLVLTDADCLPLSDQWLKGMQQYANEEIDLILAYSPYQKLKGFLNKLIRFETVFTAINYLSFALKKIPYMGVGRNLAYKRTLFFDNKGFASHMHVLSGDDDLFVNQAATKNNFAIQIHPDTHVESVPKQSFFSYIKQKRRHFGASKAYRSKHKNILAWQVFVQVFFHVSWIFCLFFPLLIPYTIGVLILNYFIKMLVYNALFKKLNSRDLIWYFPILDILLVLFLFFFGIFSVFSKNKVTWK